MAECRHQRLGVAAFIAVCIVLAMVPGVVRSADSAEALAEPVADGNFLRPAPGRAAQPVWGIKDGLAVGLWPTTGPRGLIRIYAPYLGQRRPRMINFIAIEPVAKGVRAQSELDPSRRDRKPGLAVWSADDRGGAAEPNDSRLPARGRVTRVGGTEALTFFVVTERFRNGARPVIQVILRADRPHEVGFRVHAARDSARMQSCVLTATMGNYARLRHLWLRGAVADAHKVWPEFRPDRLGFAPWRTWSREHLFKTGPDVVVAATSDEADPSHTTYDEEVPRHWRYEGKRATQYWRTADRPGLVARVNGRSTYWGGVGKIPGGVAYENLELEAPFADEQEVWFGVTPERPTVLGFKPEWRNHLTSGR